MSYSDPAYITEDAERKKLRQQLSNSLNTQVLKVCQETGMTGFSVTTNAIGLWAEEFQSLDAHAASRYFEALAVMVHPSSSHQKKLRAEAKRHDAVVRLARALELSVGPVSGNG
jgi:hypothetical protein